MEKLDLNGTWEFRCATEDAPEEWKQWRAADVPGTVHTDLLGAGLIPDPFWGDNERHVQPVHNVDWLYRRTFEWRGRERGRTYLVCEGLDTVAEIRLNGELVAEVANQFVPYRFDVSPLLRDGENRLEILFRSPLRSAEERRRRMGPLVEGYDKYDERRFYLRKAQYSFGWDWGPALPTSGIWRPVYLEHAEGPRIADIWLKTLSVGDGAADCEVEVELDGEWQGCSLEFEISRDGTSVFRDRCEVKAGLTRRRWSLKDVELWWPNGYGEPALYHLIVVLERGGETLHRVSRRVGFRTVELVLEDSDGPSFRFRINGKELFAKGANWVPSDNFLPRVTEEKYRFLLERAAAASMNMIRVWGGGIYENDVFYDLCDELGLMVWQDFMFACGVYPEERSFLRLVEEEARANVRRLRGHPSVVLWCGNNECEWIWRTRTGKLVEEMPGYGIFHKLLPRICAELDPTRPYWPTTPWGEPSDPNGEGRGNRHQWGIWSRWQDYREVRHDRSLFVTEFGWQAPACQVTLDRVLPLESRHPQSRLFEFHNKQIEGSERLFRFLAAHYRVVTDYPSFIHRTQVNQGEALKHCIEHWRRRWPKTGGALIWQLNDCWPVTSWSLIDGDLNEKAAYYFARRFFAPVIVCTERVGEVFNIWVCNDRLEPFRGTVHWQIRDFAGQVLADGQVGVDIEAQCSRKVGAVEIGEELAGKEERSYLSVRLEDDEGRPVSRTTELLTEGKHAELQNLGLRIEEFECNGGEGCLVVSSDSFAKGVYLSLPGARFEDNYFDLEPGERKLVKFWNETGGALGTSGLGVVAINGSL